MTTAARDLIERAKDRFQSGEIRFSRLVADLDEAVGLARDNLHPRASEMLRIWGQLEIINALALDEGTEPAEHSSDIDALVAELISVAASGTSH